MAHRQGRIYMVAPYDAISAAGDLGCQPAGVLKLPSLAGSAGALIHGQVVLGVVVTGVTAYLSVRFLMRYFETRTLTPFAIYCLVFGAASILHFAL